MSSRNAYGGPRRKIVLAFDIGTTYSGISYSILDPGQVPVIKGVMRFPAQETISGASKIPTVIYYDKAGTPQAVGAEASRDGVFESAMEQGWYKAEWFKLHLRSKYGSGSSSMHPSVPPLPPNKTIVQVFSDFLGYLLRCAVSYIKDTHHGGVQMWEDAWGSGGVHFVLSHPNGWEGKEQSQMRRAAVMAGLVSDSEEGDARLSFVTEGEASLHFAIENGVLAQAMEGEGVVIVDAGGGTIDVSTYKRTSGRSRIFEEIAIPQCYFHGSVFVTLQAKDFLEDLLFESSFAHDVEHISKCFDKITKHRFRNEQDPQYVKFGGTRDNDESRGIKYGQLKLAGTDVASFFRSSLDCIVQAVLEQRNTAHNGIAHVILVGGFAANDWMFEKISSMLVSQGLTVSRPELHVNKAVSDGAISFYLDHYVRARISRVTYGSRVAIPFDPHDKEHLARKRQTFRDVDGSKVVSGGFMPILHKDTNVSETKEFVKPLEWYFEPGAETTLEIKILCYRGTSQEPKWVDVDPQDYTIACTLVADFSRVPKVPTANYKSRTTYFSVSFDVILLFGLTELQAQLRWFEDGIERRSLASLVYDDA